MSNESDMYDEAEKFYAQDEEISMEDVFGTVKPELTTDDVEFLKQIKIKWDVA